MTTARYTLERVTISSSRLYQDLDLRSVTDIEIYEHIELPYVTANIAFADAYRIVDRLDLQGNEYCTIKIKTDNDDKSIEKRFVIASQLTSEKVNQTTEVVHFSLYEDVVYHSQLQNVNNGYAGSPLNMIKEISSEFLQKNISVIPDNIDLYQNAMKLVVPNLHPIDAMLWIKNRMTTAVGGPSFLFSTLALDNLYYTDLETVMNTDPINKSYPFFYGPSTKVIRDKGDATHFMPIQGYSYKNTEKLYDVIGKGLVGAEYQYYDALSGRVMKKDFDYEKDVVSKLVSPDGKTNSFAPNVEMMDKNVQEHKARRITQIGGAGVYNLGAIKAKSFGEEEDAQAHILKASSRALRTHLMKAPMTILVPGEGFLIPDEHRTIGNVLRVLFMANTSLDKTNIPIDTKKSGDYLMYATKHVFSQERYNLQITLAKVNDYKEDNIPL